MLLRLRLHVPRSCCAAQLGCIVMQLLAHACPLFAGMARPGAGACPGTLGFRSFADLRRTNDANDATDDLRHANRLHRLLQNAAIYVILSHRHSVANTSP
jgi:hypothetical protein